MSNICVFCGSSPGARPEYAAAAEELGAVLVESGHGLAYGGGHVGLMGVIADAMLERKGRVIGVVPRSLLEREVAHTGLDDLRVVGGMHERKAMLAEMSSGFIAMPGGFGTLDEIFEALTWTQLGIQSKPCGLLNVGGYFDGLLRFIEHACAEGFVGASYRDLLMVHEDPKVLLGMMAGFESPVEDKAAVALAKSRRRRS